MAENCLFRCRVGDFVAENAEDLVSKFIENSFLRGEEPSKEQVAAWKSSIKYLQKALNDRELYDLTLVFEYGLPFGADRVDLLIFGKDKSRKPKILIFELKGWAWARKTDSDFFAESPIGKVLHPEYQVLSYFGKIEFYHSEAEKFALVPVVLMYNGEPESILLDFKEVEVFFRDDVSKLRTFIKENLVSPLDEEIDEFLKGAFVHSKKLFEAVKEHFKDIEERGYLALAGKGWGLSAEQLELINEVLNGLERGEEGVVYLVKGAPGSGKTLVAFNLFLSALARGHKAILTYRNNRLIHSIREVFNSVKPGLGNSVKFYAVGKRKRSVGVAEEGFKGFFDLVVYDEAQRMTEENIVYGLERGKVSVFFYDEGQILNVNEAGTTENFEREARKRGLKVRKRFLRGFYRVRGGEEYHKFVETLITDPVQAAGLVRWRESYEFKVFNDIEELFSALREKVDDRTKVALVAAFTESPGDFQNSFSKKNRRLGYPLWSGFELYKDLKEKVDIYWLMDPKVDYVNFWLGKDSNKLERCASIYGCQGFEADFVGVVWGRDFVYRDGMWKLGDNCEDGVGGVSSLKRLFYRAKRGDKEAEEKAIRLLVNRYRIFLTRGIRGTYIFCEDKETGHFLKELISRGEKRV